MKKIILILFLVFVSISCEREVFNGILEPTTITEFGKIYLNTNPKSYNVFIDNKNWGVVTPDTILLNTICFELSIFGLYID